MHGVILHLICIIVQYLLSDSFFFSSLVLFQPCTNGPPKVILDPVERSATKSSGYTLTLKLSEPWDRESATDLLLRCPNYKQVENDAGSAYWYRTCAQEDKKRNTQWKGESSCFCLRSGRT